MSSCLLLARNCASILNSIREGGPVRKLLMPRRDLPGDLSYLQDFLGMQLGAGSCYFRGVAPNSSLRCNIQCKSNLWFHFFFIISSFLVLVKSICVAA